MKRWKSAYGTTIATIPRAQIAVSVHETSPRRNETTTRVVSAITRYTPTSPSQAKPKPAVLCVRLSARTRWSFARPWPTVAKRLRLPARPYWRIASCATAAPCECATTATVPACDSSHARSCATWRTIASNCTVLLVRTKQSPSVFASFTTAAFAKLRSDGIGISSGTSSSETMISAIAAIGSEATKNTTKPAVRTAAGTCLQPRVCRHARMLRLSGTYVCSSKRYGRTTKSQRMTVVVFGGWNVSAHQDSASSHSVRPPSCSSAGALTIIAVRAGAPSSGASRVPETTT